MTLGHQTGEKLRIIEVIEPGDYKEMSSILADQSRPPKCGGWEGGVVGSQPMSTTIHRSPNKLKDLAPYLTYI